jgi:hypothetical protein
MDKFKEQTPTTQTRRPWAPPAVKTVGTISEVLRTGGGKASPSPADPGETRKPPGQTA